jgi:LPS-assembly protein
MRTGALLNLLCAAAVCALASAPRPGLAQSGQTALDSSKIFGPHGSQMMLRADQVDYNLNTAVAVAHGHVEIDYNDRIVEADKVTYDQNKDIVTADGHVTMLAPSGTVIFSTHSVLTDQMRDGVIESMEALIGQNGRMVSPHATRSGGVRMVAQPGVFTPCKVCNKPGQRTPLWSIKASRIIYDELGHRIFYRDAIINFMGVPVAYTPFFVHPDPTVKHSSGILQPEIGSHTTLGYALRVPLYIALNDSQDMTIAPLVTQTGGEQLEVEYRQRWENGGLWLQASVANDPHAGLFGNLNQTYSSLFGSGIIPVDNTWHFGSSDERSVP